MDALQALLGTKKPNEITEKLKIKRNLGGGEFLDLEFEVKAITSAEFDAAKEQATKPVKRNGKIVHEVSEDEAKGILLAKSIVSPDFKNKQLLEHYGAVSAGECVLKALLPGEITKIEQVIYDLSGYGDFNEEVQEAKN